LLTLAITFHPTLIQQIYLDKSLDKQVRFLAIILLKNGIDRYWRRTSKHAITPENKQLIRARLFQGSIDEEDKALCLHNALVTAKIVRIEYPDDWPDALPMLIRQTEMANFRSPVQLRGALTLMLRIVKELATARLRKSQTALQAVTPELVQFLGKLYTAKTAYWLRLWKEEIGDETTADYAIENSLLALRILRRLVTVGYEQPHTDSLVCSFWSLSQNQFDEFLSGLTPDSRMTVPYQDLVGKHLIQFTKLHIDMSEMHPASFPALPNTITLVRAYWKFIKDFSQVFAESSGIRQSSSESVSGNAKHEGPIGEKLALKGLLLLRSCIATAHRPVQTFKYRSPEVKELERQAVNTIKEELLTKDMLLDMVQVIISKLFVFRKSDLEAWEEDPENWESQERTEGGAYEWAIRPCAERLLLDLITHYRELGEPLLNYCQMATNSDMDIITKESAYCALGCAAAVIHQAFDFDSFVRNSLIKDVQIQDPLAKLLRRRIAILLSQWISIRVSQETRPIIYEIFRHLLNPNDQHNDEVVRITAARQLKVIAEDFEFIGEHFYPFASDTFNLLVGLLKQVEGDEAKYAILETIRVLVSRMETHIAEFGDAIMTTLPQIWESAGSEEYMIKQSVLAITSALILSMRTASQRYHSMIIPLLREAMNPESPLHLHLIEESVELWKSIMSQASPPLNPDLVQMFQLAIPLLDYDSEVTLDCLELAKDYILLAPQDVLTDAFRRPTLTALAKILDHKARERSQLAARSIELIIRVAEAFGGSQGVNVVAQDLLEIGALRTIFEGIHSSWEADQTTGPNKKQSKISTITETDYFILLARIALADPAVFANMLTSFGNTIDQVWSWLSPRWFANFDCMADIEREKLSCLALTRLWELPNPMQDLVLDKLQDYISMWTSVVTSLADDTPDTKGRDSLVWTEVPRTEYDTPRDVCENEFAAKDPVHTVSTFEFVKARLQDMVQRVGGEQAFEENWAINVDRDVLAGFQRLNQELGNTMG